MTTALIRALPVALALAGTAHAQTYGAGQALWDGSGCTACHGANVAPSLATLRAGFATLSQPAVRMRLDTAIATAPGMAVYASLTPTERDSLTLYVGNFIPAVTAAPGLSLALASGADATVTLTNSGRLPLTIGPNVAFGGAHPGDFALATVANACPGQTIAPGASCSLQFRFTPAAGASGTRSATATVSHNASPTSTVFTLSASAAPAPAPTPAPPPSGGGGGGALTWWALLLLAAVRWRWR